MASNRRDENRVPNIAGVSSLTFTGNIEPAVNPSTHALLVESTVTPSGIQDVNITQVGGASLSLGQQLSADSIPVVLTADQLSTLTPPAAITGYALETTLSAINAKLVSGTDIGDVTINNGSGASAVNIQDGGNIITVDGTIAFSNTSIEVSNTVTVQATNLDIRDISSTQDSITVHGDVGIADQLDLSNSNPFVVAVVDANGDQITTFGTPTPSGVGDGRKVVTTAGTREALASSTPCKKVDITAETDNTGVVVVGGSTVVAALSTRRGVPLYAGDTYSLEIDNLNDINIDTTVSGEGVTFTYYT